MTFTWVGAVAGGVGLFLLGVRLMTEGLRMAAGRALHRLLKRATASRLRALLTGFGLTALVQSSSAVTVAAIGFVNAGLLGLSEALWVVFGSNIGTTATGWLVAVSGVDLDVAAYALPMIGVGALLRAVDRRRRLGAVGQAVAGLGLFFLGVAVLGDAFSELSSSIDLTDVSGGWRGQLALFFAGALLTVAMQSSSAAIAVTLSAAVGGVIDVQGAGAMVIGANLGTTSTALIAVIGATPAARRTAAGHVAFNLLAAVVALALLPWLVGLLQLALRTTGSEAIAPTLALFHTVFNVLGVLAIWPLAGRLERMLAARWVSKEEERGQPRHLDQNVLAVPEVALTAGAREMQRLARHASEIVGAALREGAADARAIEEDAQAYDRLGGAISHFVTEVSRHNLAESASEALTTLIRARRHYDTAVEQARLLITLREELAEEAPTLATLGDALGQALREAAAAANPEADDFSLAGSLQSIGRMNERFDRRRESLLEDATEGRLPIPAAILGQHFLAECRRAVRHLARGAEMLPAVFPTPGEPA